MNDMQNENRTRFQKNDEARAAQRTSTHGLSRAEATVRRASERESWTNHGRSQVPGGLILDSRTLEAKAAAIAERNQRIDSAPTIMTTRSITAIVERWVQNTDFYTSPFNSLSLNNRLRELVDAGASFSYELLNEAYDFLQKNNHIEKLASIVRKRGEIVGAAVPTLYEYVPVEEQAAIDAHRASKAIAERAKEDRANKHVPLDELKRRVAAERGVISRDSIRVFQG